MSKFSERYNTDKDAEENGQWVDFGDGIRVKVRRLNSKHSQEVRRKLEKPYVATYRNREMPASLQEELMIKQLSQSIIVDWEGVEDPSHNPAEGEPQRMLTCTPENILTIVSQFKDFRDDVTTASMERATFQKEDRLEQEGNSGNVSSGT